MKKHVKNFLKHYGEDEYIGCMIPDCYKEASDIHHVIYKSQQGSDDVSNLCALCRTHHQAAHFLVEPYLKQEYLLNIVKDNL